MGWIRVSDDFYDNDKMIAAGSIGRDLYWHGMAFCNRNLTDGLVPVGRALTLVDFTDAAVMTGNFSGVDGQECAPIALDRLLDVGLWHEEGHQCPDCIQPGPRHYIIHDYLKYQPSRAEVEAKAEANRERVRRFKERRETANANGNASSNALATALVMEQLHDTPNPNPNPNPSTSLVTYGGRVTKRNAREDQPPSQFCPKHPEGTDHPCRPCGRAREAYETWEQQAQHDELESKRQERHQARTAINDCDQCDENGMRETDRGLTRCDHAEATNAS